MTIITSPPSSDASSSSPSTSPSSSTSSSLSPSTSPGPAQNLTSLLIGFVFIVIGVPIWWKTTEIYRVSLSHAEIEALPSTPISSLVEMEVVVLAAAGRPEVGGPLSASKMAIFGQRLKERMEVPTDGSPILTIRYRGQVRVATESEMTAASHAVDATALDRNLHALRDVDADVGKVVVYLVSSSFFPPLQGQPPRVGRHRAAFLPFDDDKEELQSHIPAIDNLVRSVFVNEDALFHAFHNARGTMRLKADKESMRALKSAVEYQLTFTLLVAKPDPRRPVRWDIEDATRRYLQPLVYALALHGVALRVDSQVLYYVSLPMRPQYDATEGRYYLTLADLPHIVNPIEGKLVSHTSSCPIVHFLVYVPPPEHSPLFIYDDVDEAAGKRRRPVESNAFISARWGGMIIVNPGLEEEEVVVGDVDHAGTAPSSDDESPPRTIFLDTHPIMEVFLSQIRSLLHFDSRPSSLSSSENLANLVIDEPLDAAFTDWELDAWLRRRGLENVATSAATLKSLSDLLEKIQNIVINDEIGRQVETSLRACQRAVELMATRNGLSEAFLSSKEALDSSEKAFFDQSLLELLYFPDDQKFAIYMPLFLPIGLPIATSLIAAFKWLKTLKSERDAKKGD